MQRLMDLNMIRHIAWSFNKTTGLDFEELFQEACVACLAAEKKYKQYKNNTKTTFLYVCVKNHLKSYCKKQINNHVQPLEEKEIENIGIESKEIKSIEIKNYIEKLPEEIKMICNMVLNSPAEFAKYNSKTAKKKIKEKLKQEGWTNYKIHKNFNILRQTLKELAMI